MIDALSLWDLTLPRPPPSIVLCEFDVEADAFAWKVRPLRAVVLNDEHNPSQNPVNSISRYFRCVTTYD
jgi:hypothetical protein